MRNSTATVPSTRVKVKVFKCGTIHQAYHRISRLTPCLLAHLMDDNFFTGCEELDDAVMLLLNRQYAVSAAAPSDHHVCNPNPI